MNIEGYDIILRAITSTDVEMLMQLINDSETERMLGGSSFPVSVEEQEKWIAAQIGRTDVLRCIIAKKEKLIDGLGTVVLSDIDQKNGIAQVHIKLDKNKGRGRGIGTDALKTIVKYAFEEMRLNCVYAEVLEYNQLSQKLFEKVGFKKEGVMRSRVFKSGKYFNIISYSILKRDVNYD